MEDEFFMVNLNEAGPLCLKGEEHFLLVYFTTQFCSCRLGYGGYTVFVCNFCPVHIFKAEIDTGIKCIWNSPFSKF